MIQHSLQIALLEHNKAARSKKRSLRATNANREAIIGIRIGLCFLQSHLPSEGGTDDVSVTAPNRVRSALTVKTKSTKQEILILAKFFTKKPFAHKILYEFVSQQVLIYEYSAGSYLY